MTDRKYLNKVQVIFRDVLDNQDIVLSRETTADEIEEWDSLSHISLVVAIEKEFGIRFALGELQRLKNVGDMIDLIGRKVG